MPLPYDKLGVLGVSDVAELEEDVLALRAILIARATGQGNDNERYCSLRDKLVAEPTIRPRLPLFVRSCYSLGEFWSFIQSEFPQYQARRNFIREQFAPILDYLADQSQKQRVVTEPSKRSIDTILRDASSRLEEFASIVPRFSLIESDLLRRRAIANRLHLAWSGSWIGFHASLYYVGFSQPPLERQFNSEWGSINGIPHYWIAQSYEEVREYVDSQYVGIAFSDAIEEVMSSYKQAIDLHRVMCDDLSVIKKIPLLGHEAELLDKLEQVRWGRSTKDIVWSSAPTSTMTRDSAALAQGRKVAPHIQMEAEMDSTISIIRGINTFIADTRSLLRRINAANDLTLVSLQSQNQAEAGSPQDDREDAKVDRRAVVVVYGRDEAARVAMFEFLRSLDLRPIEWSQAVKQTGKGSPYIGEVLDAAFAMAQAVVVLLTPDDEARLRDEYIKDRDEPYERQLTPQARPNVLFEAGLAMGRHPTRTVLVEYGAMRPFSDVAGIHTVRINNSSEKRQELAQRLQTAGCQVDMSGTDWHRTGNFSTRP